LLYKRFSNGRLQWPNTQDQVEQLSHQQLEWLMSGFFLHPQIQCLFFMRTS
ncbi:IS66 family insertion sequence element accessory protein TnpB, partial [Aerococcaceae bacterium zg-ZJ1578]|nr:IS66 family insertion sequence element accessory protein TnpB [Aerococcaceae bacterium zg-1578]